MKETPAPLGGAHDTFGCDEGEEDAVEGATEELPRLLEGGALEGGEAAEGVTRVVDGAEERVVMHGRRPRADVGRAVAKGDETRRERGRGRGRQVGQLREGRANEGPLARALGVRIRPIRERCQIAARRRIDLCLGRRHEYISNEISLG